MQIADYVAFFAMGVVFCGVIYLVIWLGDLPGKIARERHHPQVAAVTAMSWLGLLFTGGIVYIAAFVWAFYDYSAKSSNANDSTEADQIEVLRGRIEALESKLAENGGQS